MTGTTSTDDYTGQVGFTRSPEAVLAALTTLDGLAGWWTRASGDGRAGGELRFHFTDDVPVRFHVDEATTTRVRWTCLGYDRIPDWTDTVVTFDLTPTSDGGCALSFRHAGLTPRLACFDHCKDGWDHFLPSLGRYVDTGVGSPRQSPADLARREARRLRTG